MIVRDITAFKTIDYVYVVNGERQLVGVLSIKELYRADPTAHIGDVTKKAPLITVKPTTDQERVIYLALKNNIKAIPVVSPEHTFLGSIPSDAILSILYKEAHEDLLRLAGFRHPQAFLQNVLEMPIRTSLRHRLPWLFLGLLGGVFAARVVGMFENTLKENLILAAFIPLIVYMSDAVGTQMEACVIRDLAMDRKLPFRRYFFRQLLIILITAVAFGLLLFLFSMVQYQSMRLAGVLGISLGAAIISSVFTGLLIPYCFSRMKLDPADASGPIATIIQDIVSIVTYFGIATVLL